MAEHYKISQPPGTNRIARDIGHMSRPIYAVPDLCCIMSRKLVELLGGVFDTLLSSAIAVFEHAKDELAVIPCLLLATL